MNHGFEEEKHYSTHLTLFLFIWDAVLFPFLSYSWRMEESGKLQHLKCHNHPHQQQHHNQQNHIFVPQLTFREVLTMLAIFDSIFITTASVTFSLPLLSSYWQVQVHVKIQIEMKIQAKIQLQIQNNGHPGLGAPPPVPVAVAAHTNISQRLNMVQFIFCLIYKSLWTAQYGAV